MEDESQELRTWMNTANLNMNFTYFEEDGFTRRKQKDGPEYERLVTQVNTGKMRLTALNMLQCHAISFSIDSPETSFQRLKPLF